MSEIDIQKTLAEYATSGSNEAFKRLVEHFGGLVYATARRQLNGDEHLAQDAMQRVFADLAKKAAKLRPEGSLGGWLHCHTCFVCSEMRRSDSRRRARENAAAELDSVKEDSNEAWLEAEANLDEAINDLREPDRIAIIARYFERASLRAIGKLLDTSEDAAQKRVTRAVDRLREKLGQRGVAISAAVLMTGLNSASAAMPPGLVLETCVGAQTNGWMHLFWTKLEQPPVALASSGVVLALVIAFTALAANETRELLADGHKKASVKRGGSLKAGVEMLSHGMSRAKTGNLTYIRGAITNHSPVELFNVRVRFDIIDQHGKVLETAEDQISVITGNTIWNYKAFTSDPDAVRYINPRVSADRNPRRTKE